MKVLDGLKERFRGLIEREGLMVEAITIKAFPLTPEEAIGNPEERDYPLVRGRERLMEATFKGAKGQAYTDLFGDYEGSLRDVLELPLRNNFQRAVLISTTNAVLRHLGEIGGTVHCKDEDPRRCAGELVRYIEERWGHPKVALIGLQPRMAEALSGAFALRIADMDPENLGRTFGDAAVEPAEREEELLRWCDLAVVTGTVLTNDTVDALLITQKPLLFYGVTAAGAAHLMGWERFCPLSS